VEFKNSLAFRISEPGKGIAAIMKMVTLTRLDCALSSAGMMRAAVSEAIFHANHRKAFGKKLIDQPLMASVLADMALDVAATSALCLRLAHAFDRADSDEGERAYARVMTPVVKYWVCKSAPNLISECMECLGGNGYVNDSNLARLYKEAPLNAIWEGAGNIQCLDVLRVMGKEPEAFKATYHMIERDLQNYASGSMDVIRASLEVVSSDHGALRFMVEQLALTAAAAQLKASIGGEVADAFVDSRLTRSWRATYGMMDNRYNAKSILKYCYPQLV
jgi:putative acyl-CoA dehydrogenase